MATPIKQIQTSDEVLHDIQSIEYIIGTQSAATNMWKGVSESNELYAGKVINYKLPYAGSTNTNTHTGLTTNTTLELTLANGSTVVYPVYRNASTAITTHYPVNSIVRLVFDPTEVTLNGHTFEGSWKTADYDSNTNTYVTQSNTTTNSFLPLIIKAATATSTVTTTVRFNNKLTGNPSTGAIKLNTTSITPTASSAITLSLPATGGTLALTSDIPSSLPPTAHTHAWGDITNPPASYTPTAHTHDYSKVSATAATTVGTDIGTITIDNNTTTLKGDFQKSPLIGNTSNTTPSQVAAALENGQDVFIETTQNFLEFNETFLFKMTVYGKNVSRLVIGSGIFKYGSNLYAIKLEGAIQSDTWNWNVTEVAKSSDIPSKVSDLDNDIGYITGITSPDVTTALGFTPSAEGHSHTWGDITNPPSSFTPSAHTHDYSKVSITSNSKGPIAGTITIDEITTTLKTGINNTPSANSNYYILGITSDTDATLTKTKVGYIKNGDTSTITIGGPGSKKSSLDYTSLSLADQDGSHTYIGTIKTANTLTANRTYTLQDKSGTIALTSDITDAIGGITSFDYTTTTTLPASGSKGTIYLVGHTHGTNDVYDEYIYVGSSWEKIGNTDIDLSNYVPTSRTINNKSLTTNIDLDYQDVGAAPVSHSHPWGDITNPPSSYTPTAHSHPVTTSTTTVVTGVGSNGTTSALTGVKFTSTTTALTSVVATTTSIYPAANVTALTSVTRSTTSIYPAANVTAITSVTGSTITMYGTGTIANVMSAPTVVNNVLSWTLVSTANATGATVVNNVTTSGQSVRGTATTVVNAVTIGAGSSVRASAVTVATGALTTKTATVGTGVGSNGTATVLTGVKASSTATAITGVTVGNNT